MDYNDHVVMPQVDYWCPSNRGASDRKMADFMMDGHCLVAFDAVFGTVRQFFRRFSDGRSGIGRVWE